MKTQTTPDLPRQKHIGIIPARLASSRFPNKPLAMICGIPMLGHVYFRSKMSTILAEVYVATCDKEISDYIEHLGGKSVMTQKSHTRASDRTAEALQHIENDGEKDIDIVVMIQGDEPMLRPEMIDEAIQPLLDDPQIQISNLMANIKSISEHEDPNEIKVVVDKNNFALYFSREPIPSRRASERLEGARKQVCIIPFKRDFLMRFTELEPTCLEIKESIDMLRVLEHGYAVKMVQTEHDVYSVDTESDRRKVENIMERDPLVAKYAMDGSNK